MNNKFKRIFKICLAIFLIHILIFVGYGWFANPKTCKTETALVILGNKVYPDGQVSPVLKSRLNKAIELYYTGCYALVIASGGLGKEGIYEGDAMAAYLESFGIPKLRIVIDNQGNNSYLTAINSKSILKSQGIQSVVVVTSYYHVLRAMLAMKFAGIEDVRGAGSHYLAFQDVLKIPRDIAGFYVYIFKYGF
ncbi:MAG TPA: YdcF family protein [Candidatus Paceibacterota bacterium]|nr:YdcF family protein [Candidatus Paceibacterota bacterium]